MYQWIDGTNLDSNVLTDRILAAIEKRRGVDKERERELASETMSTSLDLIRSSHEQEEKAFRSWAKISVPLERALLVTTAIASLAAGIVTTLSGDVRGAWLLPLVVLISIISVLSGVLVSIRARAHGNEDKQ
jgi:hypothetical protein